MFRQHLRWLTPLLALLLLLTLGGLPAPVPVAAATRQVLNGDDAGAGSLRDTIAGAADGDIITFATGVDTVNLTSGGLAITKSLTIDGSANGHVNGVTIQVYPMQSLRWSIFTIDAPGSTVNLAYVTITKGKAPAGGGIYVADGTVTLTNSTVSDNFTQYVNTAPHGGGIYVAGGTVALINSTVSGNVAQGDGGGIYVSGAGRVELTNSTVSHNAGFDGGGMFGAGTVKLTNSTVSHNAAGSRGGGMFDADGTVELTNSTLSSNTALYGGGVALAGTGGSITLTNSTVSGNTGEAGGGGVYIGTNNSNIRLVNSTLSGNATSGDGGGVYATAGTVALAGTVIAAGVGATTCDTLSGGTLTDGGYNLESADTCGFTQPTSLSNTDPQLGPLADHGGPTQTHLPAVTSPANNRIPAETCATLLAPPGPGSVDQRGVARPLGAACDIGAVEAGPYTLVANPVGGPSGGTTTLTATLTADGLPASGITLAFTLRGTAVGTAITGNNGVAVLAGASLAGIAPGTYPGGVGASVPTATVTGTVTTATLTVAPVSNPCAGFTDVADTNPACAAIAALAQAGVIKGYNTTPPTYGPAANVQRAQAAAMLVRALGWQDHPSISRTFTDLGTVDAELQQAVRILANACDSQGQCVARGYTATTFGPEGNVSHAQVIAFVARAFQLDPTHAWMPQTGPTPYTGVPAIFAGEFATYHHYVSSIPEAPTTQAGWDAPASRAWVARVLWAALFNQTH